MPTRTCVTPDLCCDGLAFQKRDLDNMMGSTVLSLHRVHTTKIDSNEN